MIAAMSMMKDAQKIQADALLRSFNQQQNASQTQVTPVQKMTPVSSDIPVTVVAAANLQGVKSKSKFKPKFVKSRKQKASPSSSPSSDSSFSVDDTESSDKSAASKPEEKEKDRKKKAPTRKQISSDDDSDNNPNFSGKEITSESRKKRKSKFSSSSSRLPVTEQAATLPDTWPEFKKLFLSRFRSPERIEALKLERCRCVQRQNETAADF
ncbi:unnamed protein product [Didymodactylos carnosus]|uniref:Uncharacterized protein n=1 Tax=Didymodactylos carnosus TaxID=1234261 RepID=A0A815H1M8_9BILA|nr:unnamed protein product [Didymodactylos carnosus]CAF4210148.1 unnamed protein product [Didymodactylos carnosus]